VKAINKSYAVRLYKEFKTYYSTASSRGRVGMSCVKELRELNTCLKSVRGNAGDESKGEAVRNVALAFLLFPADPTGISYGVGAATYSVSLLIKNVERKNSGVRDVIRIYRRLLASLEGELKC